MADAKEATSAETTRNATPEVAPASIPTEVIEVDTSEGDNKFQKAISAWRSMLV